MNVNLIAAVGRSGQLGLYGRLPWHDPEDLRWFRSNTIGGVIIVGYRTAQMLPTLPGRTTLVWERREAPERFLARIRETERTIWVAGGEKTYAAFMPFVRRAYITRIDYDGPADTFMPELWNSSRE